MKIIIFFTYGMSLKLWSEVGILSRELELYREISKKNVEICFFTYGNSTDFDVANSLDFNITVFPLYYYKKINKNKFIDVLETLALIFKNRSFFKNFNLFKSNQFWGAWLPFFCKLLFKKKFILRCGFEFNKFANRSRSRSFVFLSYCLSHLMYRFADNIFVTSADDLDYIAKQFLKGSADKIKLIPNLINTDIFTYKCVKPSRVLLVIARLEEQKNVKLALKVASKLKLSITIVGRGSQKNEILQYAESNLIDFKYYEVVENSFIPHLLADHYIYLTTSLYEGNPKSLLEAMSSESIVVARNSPGISSIIEDGINGFLFNDEDELLSVLSNLIIVCENDSKRQVRLNARTYVKKHHELSAIADAEYSLYRHNT
jgi:glycosyltransferase involved in cell wall biosynthesis